MTVSNLWAALQLTQHRLLRPSQLKRNPKPSRFLCFPCFLQVLADIPAQGEEARKREACAAFVRDWHIVRDPPPPFCLPWWLKTGSAPV